MLFEAPAEDHNDLMLLIVEGERRLLEMFGLPCTLSHSKTLQYCALKQDLALLDVELLYSQLGAAAEEYLLGPVTTDIELLEQAQEKKLYIDEVLPLMSLKLKAEPYYLYLYLEFFLKDLISARLFLEEVKIVQQNNLSSRLHELSKDTDWQGSAEYQDLAEYGLMYMESFLNDYTAFETKFYEQALNT
mgnify:CR=1 FL=1